MKDRYSVTICYATITPESAENGDFADNGIEDEFTEVFFSAIFDHNEIRWNSWYLSDSHISDHTWLYTIPETRNYSTGEEIEYTLHIKRIDGKPLSKRNWRYLLSRLSIEGVQIP